MYKITGILLSVIILQGCTNSATMKVEDEISDSVKVVTIIDNEHQQREKILNVLKKTYPDFFSNCEVIGDNIRIGRDTIIFDDGKNKNFICILDDADIEDMFAMRYSDSIPPDYLMDAGRLRCEPLFKLMYGGGACQVRRNLVKVSWLGECVWFNSRNGAADSLCAVAAELKNRPDLKKLTKSSGTFNWREVRGAKRMSAHSYGIAIDVGIDHSNYWRWDHPKANELDKITYKNRLPLDLVEIFEKHGFIWGGRWYHYDTMHFEFRPEILEYNKHTDIYISRI